MSSHSYGLYGPSSRQNTNSVQSGTVTPTTALAPDASRIDNDNMPAPPGPIRNQTHRPYGSFPSPSISDSNKTTSSSHFSSISSYSNNMNYQGAPSNARPYGQNAQKTLNFSEISSVAAGDSSWETRPRTILVNEAQNANQLIRYIHHVQLCFGPTMADFEFGGNSCALYLSLKFHKMHPKYILNRFLQLSTKFSAQYLIVLVDLDQSTTALNELTSLSYQYHWTMLCAWSFEEAARYVEALRILREDTDSTTSRNPGMKGVSSNINVSSIKGKSHLDSSSQAILSRVLQVVKGLNKSDMNTITNNFQSFAQLANATPDELATCPGFGPNKVDRIYRSFRQPLSNAVITSRSLPESTSYPKRTLQDIGDMDDVFMSHSDSKRRKVDS